MSPAFRLIWLEEAVQDIARLRRFLEPNNPRAAAGAARCILDGAKRLQRYPESGAPMGDGRRELFLPFGSSGYVLRYRLDGATIVIIRVCGTGENDAEKSAVKKRSDQQNAKQAPIFRDYRNFTASDKIGYVN